MYNSYKRPRRNRKSESIRNLTQETTISITDFIFPLFITEGNNIKDEIGSMPNIFRLSLDNILREIEHCVALGLNNFVLFPVINEIYKDTTASYSYSENCFYLNSISEIKKRFPQICLMSDVAMDPYSSDGHDGFLQNGQIDNDKTLPILAKMSLAQAQAGIDIIGPSDMMDGRVGLIRQTLDKNGYQNTSIMSYTAKYASAFYGPFRDALDSAPKSGDKKTYQMNPANKREAIIEAEIDIAEGADFIMVKPALAYLDIIHILNERFDVPIAAYNVSGEYAMLHAAAKNGWLDYDRTMQEMLLSIKRAGARIIISYFAKDFALLKK
ncbi:MAG: porphobilinogen synthase [Bacteroidales bacterium]|nr:porphobilinogen synthase [Bacteroidales bacterium]